MSTTNLIRIARQIESQNPILAYELESSARAIAAVTNPGRTTHDERVEESVALLESLREELQTALADYETAEEFAKFFTDPFLEEEELKKILDKSVRAASVAGIWDTVKEKAKGLFKKDDKRDEDSSVPQSYRMDEGAADDFVEGKADWSDPSHYVEKETKENREFFDGSREVIDRMADLRDRPSRRYVEWMLEEVNRVLDIGKKILGKPSKPAKKPESKPGPSKPSTPKKDDSLPPSLGPTVDHYVDMLKEHSGDSKKTIQLLRELFSQVGPSLEPERASLASRRAFAALVRIAKMRRDLRPVLLPRLARVAGRQPVRMS
jgi:hypothetical protein